MKFNHGIFIAYKLKNNDLVYCYIKFQGKLKSGVKKVRFLTLAHFGHFKLKQRSFALGA